MRFRFATPAYIEPNADCGYIEGLVRRANTSLFILR